VFGSISVKQIKEKLSKYNLDKKQIIVDNPITSLGFHEIKINLYKDIIAKIKIEVKK
jgi:large subunit ribosomal protein L9